MPSGRTGGRVRLGSLAVAALLSFAAPMDAQAQGDVVLMADRVFLAGNNQLTAEGNVEAIKGKVRLQAQRITYDRRGDRIVVEGPIRLSDGDDVTILASYAELDAEMQTGLLRSARMVLAQQVQLAAVELARVDGRYSQLQKAAVTSCRVCNSDEPPLWQIRARRVVHDHQERQLYFHDAKLLVRNTPIIMLPRLRLPDPTLKRARGFMVPSVHSNTQLGIGIKIPYFIPVGPSKDITLTPYLSPETQTLQFRYRQAFATGRIEFNGALSNDTLMSGNRGYVFGEGEFYLPRDFRLTFDLKGTTDDAYLLDYNYSNRDRLDSDVIVARTRRDEDIRIGFLHYQSLRADENNSTIPTLVAVAEYERRFFPSTLGGELRLGLTSHTHYRTSNLAFDGPDANLVTDGRDVSRAMVELEWNRNWTWSSGIRTGVTALYAGDAFVTQQDDALPSSASQGTPALALHMRYPLVKSEAGGGYQVLEPVAQIGWVGGDALAVANDESTRVEFDEGNLLSLSRFPSPDRRERGLTGAFGVGWTRVSPGGMRAHLTLGQVVRDTADGNFSNSSGLSGTQSDLLFAGQIKLPSGLSLAGRGLFDPKHGASKAEARASWQSENLWLDATYVWLGSDTAEDRPSTISEWSLDGRYRVSRHWSWLTNWRYDVAANDMAEAGLGVEYRNECVKLDFSVSRRYTSSTTVQPSTDFGFTVALLGFTGNSGNNSYQRTCRNDAG